MYCQVAACYSSTMFMFPLRRRCGLDVVIDGGGGGGGGGKFKHTHTHTHTHTAQKDPREQHKASVQRCIQFLVHASQCRDPLCTQPGCIKIECVLGHFKNCRLQASVSCAICKAFLLLSYSHAKSCTDEKCLVLLCTRIKKKLREQLRNS